MPHWPLALRLLITAVVLVATAAAFATGQMVLAVIGVAACFVAFKRLFLTP